MALLPVTSSTHPLYNCTSFRIAWYLACRFRPRGYYCTPDHAGNCSMVYRNLLPDWPQGVAIHPPYPPPSPCLCDEVTDSYLRYLRSQEKEDAPFFATAFSENIRTPTPDPNKIPTPSPAQHTCVPICYTGLLQSTYCCNVLPAYTSPGRIGERSRVPNALPFYPWTSVSPSSGDCRGPSLGIKLRTSSGVVCRRCSFW